MALQKVEFEFPDPDKDSSSDVIERANGDFDVVVEGRESLKSNTKDTESKAKNDEFDIEIVDDRAEEDRGKQKSKAPLELTDEEMESYSDRVKKRLQHFSKGFHDQRRAAESAERERQEALRYAQQVAEENKKLKGTVSKNQEVLLEQAKRTATSEMDDAEKRYKSAYEAGNSDEMLAAQKDLHAAASKIERVNNIKLPSLQDEESGVKPETFAPAPANDPKADSWQAKNKWFGDDDEMTAFALGLHQKLVKQGVDPRSDEYYERIDTRMRKLFPEQFTDGDDGTETDEPRRRANVVAPATRSVAPKKVTLTRTQVALAKKLGVPLTEYAKQVALEIRKQNG